MDHEMKEKLIRDVDGLIRESVGEIAGRVWEIYTRSKLDYVDKKDVTAELLELYNDIEGTVNV